MPRTQSSQLQPGKFQFESQVAGATRNPVDLSYIKHLSGLEQKVQAEVSTLFFDFIGVGEIVYKRFSKVIIEGIDQSRELLVSADGKLTHDLQTMYDGDEYITSTAVTSWLDFCKYVYTILPTVYLLNH